MSSDIERRRRFETIVEEVFDPLQRYLRRRAGVADTDDLLSDVLLTVWRRIEDVPEQGALPWCYGVARHTLANQRRSQTRHLRLVERIAREPSRNVEPDPADAGPDAELTAALELLSDDDREILRLWAWEQLEPREMAGVLDITVNAASLRLSRARSRLAGIVADRMTG